MVKDDEQSRTAPESDDGPPSTRERVFVDAHVHLHDGIPAHRFVRAVSGNVCQQRDRAGRAPTSAMIMLTESHGVEGFERLQACDGAEVRVRGTAEPVSLRVDMPGKPPLFVIAGRQIITAEKLEVLALGTREVFPDGQDVASVIDRVGERGALAVLPWGFGKWTGTRGRRVREIVEDTRRFPHVLVGDNGGRPGMFRRPPLLSHAERLGRLVLPGTDPLPLPGEIDKIGRFGFVADCELDPDRPFRSLRDWLARQRVSPPQYGELERLPVFVRRQVELRLPRRH